MASVRRSSSRVFSPPIEPVISSSEVAAYYNMLDGSLSAKDSVSLSSTSVVVVGAGLAGLAAARELKKSGVNVTILEVSDRAGGRCHTVSSPDFDEDVFAEAGGMRFPTSHKIIMKYIDIFGLKTVPFANMKDRSGLLFFDGKKKFIDQELQDADSLLSRVVQKWDESIGPIRLAYNSGALTWDDLTAKFCSVSLLDFLHKEKWTSELIDGFSKYGVGLGAYQSILGLSFLEILRMFIMDKAYDGENVQLEGGMKSITNAFLLDDNIPLNSVIEYGKRVTSISLNSEGRCIVTSNESSPRKGSVSPTYAYECDYVIVTIPLPHLRSVAFTPPLRKELTDAIHDVHYVQAAKIFLQTKSRFWLNHGVDGMMISDLPLQNTYFSPAFSSSSKGMITASYVWEDQAKKLLALSNDEKISLAIKELSKAFPEIEQEFERGAAVEWKQGFCIFRPDQAQKYHQILREEALPGVFLAGEHCSVEHGYFEGALESGLRAAAGVFRSLDESFLDQFDNVPGITCIPLPQTTTSANIEDEETRTETCRSGVFYDELEASSRGPTTNLQICLKRLDHYTLICRDAKEVADFHSKNLHFDLDSIKPINTGTVREGEHDMLNYIMRPPGNKDMLMVVTEGLNDETIFRKYMMAHGPGIHHVAFEVDNLDATFATIKEAGIQTTSDTVTTDVISGLKQFFIAPSHAGFFIELIERPCSCAIDKPEKLPSDAVGGKLFSRNSMKDLAQSITKFVPSRANGLFMDYMDYDYEEEKKFELYEDEEIDMAGLKIGEIAAIEISVENLSSSTAFLVDALNFRFIRHTGNRTFLGLPGASQGINIVLNQAGSAQEERKATVMFNSPTMTCHKADELTKSRHFTYTRVSEVRDECVILSDHLTSYKVLLAHPDLLSEECKVVQVDSVGTELTVDINVDKSKLFSFLSDPSNLSLWTGHRALHFSSKEQCWVETRVDTTGSLTSFVLSVTTRGDSVYFSWPQRNVEITFHCAEIVPGFCSVSVALPSTQGERTLAKMKRIITIELDLLKATMENNVRQVIPDQYYLDIQSYHLTAYGVQAKRKLPDDLSCFGFHGDVITSGALFEKMSTDFALTIWSQPLAILKPTSTGDVQASVRMASACGIPLAARGSQVSHSAGGQAQSDGGILLDMSQLSSVEFIENGIHGAPIAVRAGAGTFWDEVIRKTLHRGLMPPVINDYQYLSVGGTISMGGVGFMSHRLGIQAAHVLEMEVVTGQGEVLVCNNDQNRDLFDSARGGLGQCGIITSVTIPLIKAPKKICTFKLFYHARDATVFSEDLKTFIESDQIEMIHAFVKPCTRKSISTIVGSGALASSSRTFLSSIDEAEPRGLVFFLELGCYKGGDELRDASRLKLIEKTLLSKARCIGGEYFSEESDFQTYITKDPPVVETNKAHGTVPHPSFATILAEEHLVSLLERHLCSSNRGDDSTNEILIMPIKSNSSLNTGYHSPMFPMPEDSELSFFLLFLGSVIPRPGEGATEIMSALRSHHRDLYKLSISLGGKRYSYDTITNEVSGEKEWKEHFGSSWENLVLAKRKHDPHHVLCPGIKMWS